MGYSTNFTSEFKLDRPLKEAHRLYLQALSDTRRMRRDEVITARRSDPLREAVGLPVGIEGAFFVNEDGHAGQGKALFDIPDGVTEYNAPPRGQPGLWCEWEPTESGGAIRWSGAEKFYDYVEWLQYLIRNFLKPWGYVLNGEVEWQGEDNSDRGQIVVKDNVVKIPKAVVTYVDDES